MSVFKNQLKTKEEREIFLVLELNIQYNKTIESLISSFESVEKRFPNISLFPWYEPLKKDFIEQYQNKENEQKSLNQYFRFIERQYIGRPSLFFSNEPLGLSNFSEKELAEPHKQWIKELDRKYKHYHAIFPTLKNQSCLNMARYSTLNDLSDNELLDLYTVFSSLDCDYNTSMTFFEWVEWFETSKENLNSDLSFTEKFDEKMTTLFHAWKNDSDETIHYSL